MSCELPYSFPFTWTSKQPIKIVFLNFTVVMACHHYHPMWWDKSIWCEKCLCLLCLELICWCTTLSSWRGRLTYAHLKTPPPSAAVTVSHPEPEQSRCCIWDRLTVTSTLKLHLEVVLMIWSGAVQHLQDQTMFSFGLLSRGNRAFFLWGAEIMWVLWAGQ